MRHVFDWLGCFFAPPYTRIMLVIDCVWQQFYRLAISVSSAALQARSSLSVTVHCKCVLYA